MSTPVHDFDAEALLLPAEDRARLLGRLIASFEPAHRRSVPGLRSHSADGQGRGKHGGHAARERRPDTGARTHRVINPVDPDAKAELGNAASMARSGSARQADHGLNENRR